MIVKRLGRGRLRPDAARRCAPSPRRATRDTPDELWLCEHPPVYTQGLAGRAEHVLDAGAASRSCRPTAAARSPTTGPGQVVAYPLVDLRRLGIYVKEYVFRLEQARAQDARAATASPATACAARRASTCGWTTRSAMPR